MFPSPKVSQQEKTGIFDGPNDGYIYRFQRDAIILGGVCVYPLTVS